MTKPLPFFVKGMWGLGDNIYQRPFVRELSTKATVYLETPWPELYQDIPNVLFVQGNRQLRTQQKNMRRQLNDRWSNAPRLHVAKNISYNMRAGSIITDMAQAFGLMIHPATFIPQLDLPPVPYWQKEPLAEISKPIALVRPVTVRTEWTNTARNPLPEYIYEIAEQLMKTHYVILVADIASKLEMMQGELPPCHYAYLNGELNVDQLLALVQASDILVGGVGWIVPAAIAAHKRAFIVLGGQGGHNRPEKLIHPSWAHRLGFAYPERFCQCVQMRHNCNKIITNLSEKFAQYQAKAG